MCFDMLCFMLYMLRFALYIIMNTGFFECDSLFFMEIVICGYTNENKKQRKK